MNYKLGILLIFFFVSCKNEKKDVLGMALPIDECILKNFFDNAEKEFSNFNIGMTRAAFDENHVQSSIFTSADEVIDSLPLCKNDQAYCENAYRFINSELSDIQSTYYLKNADDPTIVINAIYSQLTEKFGNATTEKGVYTWMNENESRILYIYLSDETVRFNRPVVQLQYITEGKISV